jgi:acyl-CoA oxidase
MPDTDRAELISLFSDDIFDPPGDITNRERMMLTYRRMAYINDRLAASMPLLHHPDLLRDLLELSAMVDPPLFHVLFLHHCLATGALLDYTADLPGQGDGFGTILLTELGLGNTSGGGGDQHTRVVYDPAEDDFVLTTPSPDATKFPPNVGLDGVAKWGVLGARLIVAGADCGAFGFLVQIRDENGPRPGVHIKPLPPTSLLPVDYACVQFDHVRLPRRQWLRDSASISADGIFHDAHDGLTRMLRAASLGRFAWGANCVGLAGAARASVAVTVPHAYHRLSASRSGDVVPVIHFRNQQRLLLTALAAALAATALARSTSAECWRLPAANDGPPALTPAFMRTASVTKVAVDLLAERAASRARASCGALGFFSVNHLIDYEGLALAYKSAGGDNQMTLLNSAWIMAQDIDYEAPASKPAGQAGVGRLDELDSLIGLLCDRERLLHQHLQERMRAGAADPFTAWNAQIALAQELAEAHLARLTAEAFAAWADRETDPKLHPHLRRLCELLILEEIADHSGWYLVENLLGPADVTSLPDLLDSRCDQLFPHLRELVSLLDVPLEILRAPLATDDYMAAFTPAP